jgi:DNA-directed RNA polymerase specialized sigma24 family protein
MESARESDLVAEAQGGDRDAFLSLARHYQRPLYRLAFALSHDTEEAASLTAETFARAWAVMREYPTGKRFFPWLLKIARSVPLAPAAGRADAPPGPGILAAFEELRDDERLALALHAAGPFRYEEIAALLGVPLGVAILRISQARGVMVKRARRDGGAA